MAYIIGNRNQKTLFPPTIEDYVGTEDPVRAYDAFVENMDFQEMGLPIIPFKAGAHEYHPKSMVKLLIYGYSYGIRSSRKLERACHHNLSFMWLVSGIQPDYRTIARFRKENKEAIKKYLEIAEKNIDRLMEEVEQIDQEEENIGSLVKVNKDLQDQKKLQEKVREISKQLKETGKEKINSTDIDSVNGKSRQGSHAIMNCQISTDEKHGLIVNSDAVSQNNDLNQFASQVEQSKETLERAPANVVSDAGYFSLDDIDKVPEGVKVIMPSRKQAQKENKKTQVKPFGTEEFHYDKESDEYTCPAGKTLKKHKIAFGDENKIDYKANGKECRSCERFGVCTTSKNGRHIIRMKENEELKAKLEETYQQEEGQKLYKLRKEKVELPFGHMKRNLGAGQFLLRGKEGVNAELSILSTCFNIARMITIIGIPMLIAKLNSM